MTKLTVAAIAVAAISFCAPAYAGTVRAKSGATARVADGATSNFQCLVSKLEGQGYPVKFMRGYGHGTVRGSLHPSGMALDVNQTARGRTTPRMPHNEISLAASCGLLSGAVWRNNDSGHFQKGGYSGRRHARRHRR
jgi:hypothetical protein